MLHELIEEIDSLVEDRHWKMPVEYVLNMLSMSQEEYYRHVYTQSSPFSSAHANEDYGPHNVEELVQLLAAKGFPHAEECFCKAGYYFSQSQLLHWTEFFLSVSMSRLLSHTVDREALDTALVGCRNPRDAFEFYFHSFFDPDEMISFACDIYLRNNRIEDHSYSRGSLTDYIKEQISQSILRWEEIGTGLFQKLHEKAIEWKLMEEGGEIPPQDKSLPMEIVRALESLEFYNTPVPPVATLKTQYRRLLKKYHPDLNPSGLEKTRELNHSYTLILSYLN